MQFPNRTMLNSIIFIAIMILMGVLIERYFKKWSAKASDEEKKEFKEAIKKSDDYSRKIIIGIVLIFIILILVNNSDLFK